MGISSMSYQPGARLGCWQPSTKTKRKLVISFFFTNCSDGLPNVVGVLPCSGSQEELPGTWVTAQGKPSSASCLLILGLVQVQSPAEASRRIILCLLVKV